MGMARVAGVALTAIGVMMALTSCDSKSDGGGQVVAAVKDEKPLMEMTLSEKCEAEFRRVVASTNNTSATNKAVYDILGDVLKLPEDEVLPLLERFLDIANTASLEPITSYPVEYTPARHIQVRRDRWFERMFEGIVMQVFYLSMKHKKDPYDNWDKFFAFFEKGTNELAMVDRCQLVFDKEAIAARRKNRAFFWGNCPELTPSQMKNAYLRDLGEHLLRWIHLVRDMHIGHLDRHPTAEQKARIFKRFDELEEFIRPFTKRKNAIGSDPNAANLRRFRAFPET